jgi:hypothetical protein
MKTVNIDTLKKVAKDLIDDGTNVEYVRGICELIADIDGLADVEHAERAMQIAVELGMSEHAAKQMYSPLKLSKYTTKILHDANSLIIEMGATIRLMDKDDKYTELWTNDGDYIPDDRYKALETLLKT